MAVDISLTVATRLTEELKKEHGHAPTGLRHELAAEVATLIEAADLGAEHEAFDQIPDLLDRPDNEEKKEIYERALSAGSQIARWPSIAANNISQRLYVNRTKMVQFALPTDETRLARSEDNIAAWLDQEKNRTLRRLILAEPLPPRERQAILLYLSGHTDRAAAERLGVAPGTVKEYLQRARKRLAASSALCAFVFD